MFRVPFLILDSGGRHGLGVFGDVRDKDIHLERSWDEGHASLQN